MKNIVNVIVEWLDKKALNLPSGIKYITVAKFYDEREWEKEAWSVVLEFDVSPKQQGNPSKGKAYFLVPNAPQELLISGIVFELYEGAMKTAKVIVI